MDWDEFRRHFCDPDAEDCQLRISTQLSYTMMRRTMSTTILNRPIITLPTPHLTIRYIDFSPEERIIYRITENRARSNLNHYIQKGLAQHCYGLFMVQLLRLRQCTSHPFMLERAIRESWTSEDVAELQRKLTSLSSNTKPFYEQCKVWVAESEAERTRLKEGDPIATEKDENGVLMPFGQADFGRHFSMDQALSTLNTKKLFKRVMCWICSDLPIAPHITSVCSCLSD